MKATKRILYAIVCLSFCVLALASGRAEHKPEENTLTTSTSVKTTEAPTGYIEATDKTSVVIYEEPSEKNSAEWKTAYLNLLESKKDTHYSYSLVNIDGDNIPELYMSGDCEATGDGVYSYKNGSVVEQRLNRIGGGYYIPKSGKLYNQNGNMGYYYTGIYKLTDEGFVKTFSGSTTERVETMPDGEYELSCEYSIEDKVVSEEQFNTAVSSAFDINSAVALYENTVDYEIIKQQIINY